MIVRYDRWMNSLMSEMLLMDEVIACIDDKKMLYSNKMISLSQDQVMHIDFNNIDKSFHWIKTVKLI